MIDAREGVGLWVVGVSSRKCTAATLERNTFYVLWGLRLHANGKHLVVGNSETHCGHEFSSLHGDNFHSLVNPHPILILIRFSEDFLDYT